MRRAPADIFTGLLVNSQGEHEKRPGMARKLQLDSLAEPDQTDNCHFLCRR